MSDYSQNMSLRLSHILNDIGVNEKIVLKRRRLSLLNESFGTIGHQFLNIDVNCYKFGSQIEGTTTLGLQSDSDSLSTYNQFNVIQDWSEWEHGKRNLLMIQDETVSPGYCLLQILRDDAPLPVKFEIGQDSYRDSAGRILLKNTFFHIDDEGVRHGPAQSYENIPGVSNNDIVAAFSCNSWPVQSEQRLDQLSDSSWPTRDMRKYCKDSGCFVVGVGSKGSANEDIEWRISTSLAERCLMFNLNITQIRCYVLMKMIMKTFITPYCSDSISSFMCKTVLLHCISNMSANTWKENTLLTSLTYCLSTLCNCVLNEYCPHYMVPRNNLMRGRFSSDTKRIILENISYVMCSNGRALLEIDCDSLGMRIQNTFISNVELFPDGMSTFISGQILKSTLLDINGTCNSYLKQMTNVHDKQLVLEMFRIRMLKILCRLVMYPRQDKIVCRALVIYSCSTLGSVLASYDIYSGGRVGKEALTLMSFGLPCDVATGKLKLASIFYCTGDMVRTELVLKNIEECYDLHVIEPICKCYDFQHDQRRRLFNKLSYDTNDEISMLHRLSASCVKFLRCEINCCPHELQHEMFRSTREDLHFRTRDYDWMDMAVIDSLAYLYFLQYKVYSRLGRNESKQRALSNLARCIVDEPNFGHKETALNLLGQCMEQENKIDAAFKCYLMSLKILETNNAAKFHICRLLCSMYGNHAI